MPYSHVFETEFSFSKSSHCEEVSLVTALGLLCLQPVAKSAGRCEVRSNYAYERKVEETTSENFILFQSLAATELKVAAELQSINAHGEQADVCCMIVISCSIILFKIFWGVGCVG